MTEVGGVAQDRLRSLIERIEKLEEEKKNISSDITDVFSEAKSAGFDTKALRAVLKLRKMNAADRDEQELLVETLKDCKRWQDMVTDTSSPKAVAVMGKCGIAESQRIKGLGDRQKENNRRRHR